MKEHSTTMKVIATVLVLSLQAAFIPVQAETPTASISGTVLSAETQQPLPGARFYAADPNSGEIYQSGVTSEDGGFAVAGLPASTYQLAVESDGGLYLVGTPVKLAPGQTQDVNVAVNPEAAPSPEEAEKNKKKGGTGIWNNPLTAALIVAGAAIVLGVIVNETTKDDDEKSVSPSSL